MLAKTSNLKAHIDMFSATSAHTIFDTSYVKAVTRVINFLR